MLCILRPIVYAWRQSGKEIDVADEELREVICPICGTIDQAQYRIEALRAASRIVAGVMSAQVIFRARIKADDVTLRLAEQFALWLEKGER